MKDLNEKLPTNLAWLVIGTTGEHCDFSEWIVAAFTTKDLAESFKDLCQMEANKVNGKDFDTRYNFQHPYDRQFCCEYNGTHYYVKRIEVFSSL